MTTNLYNAAAVWLGEIEVSSITATGTAYVTGRLRNDGMTEWLDSAKLADGRKCGVMYIFTAAEMASENDELIWSPSHIERVVLASDEDDFAPSGAVSEADLRGAKLIGACLPEANLAGENLRGANLRRANLRFADLSRADLSGSDLVNANLRGASLREADLRGANMVGADMSGADLRGANLTGANLRGAKLHEAYMRGANLTGANLVGAYLRGANMVDADLRGSNMVGAYLVGANLTGADLTGADLDGYLFQIPGSRHSVLVYGSKIVIGCITKTIDEWRDVYKQVGEANSYTPDQIQEYGYLLELASARMEEAK